MAERAAWSEEDGGSVADAVRRDTGALRSQYNRDVIHSANGFALLRRVNNIEACGMLYYLKRINVSSEDG